MAGLVLATAACGSERPAPGEGLPTGGGGSSPTNDFIARAGVVSMALRRAGALTAYRDGLVLLGEPTRWGGFTDENAKEAAAAGRALLALPDLPAPKPVTLTFTDGTERRLALIPARRAAGLAITDPCGPTQRCALSLDAATLVDTPVQTNHGSAKLPFWRFTGGGMTEPLLVLALDRSELLSWQIPELPAWTPEGIAAPISLDSVDGTTLHYNLGLGACDTEAAGLIHEEDDVVILGGTFTPPASGTVCTAQLVSVPVTAQLTAPLGNRPLVDVATGAIVTTLPTG